MPWDFLLMDARSGRDPKLSKARLEGARVYYIHEGYGCSSGCCGHTLNVLDATGEVLAREFEFSHDKETLDAEAGELASILGVQFDRAICEFRED